ncbi:MAG: hypothetical protein ACREFO_06595 [Acetobacteraceae bacterium]
MARAVPEAWLAWSTGKDSAFALLEARRLGLAEITGVLTTVAEAYGRVSMHGVRTALLERQVAALGLPALTVALPSPCPNEVYDERMAQAVERIKAKGIRYMVFGDLFLADVRAYREARLAAAGMRGIFPLWGRDTAEVARTIIAMGFVAHLVTVDPQKLDRGFAGRKFDDRLLAALPGTVDPCGENGEFHTFVSAGPMFAEPIAVRRGKIVERDGFVFADLIPDPPNDVASATQLCRSSFTETTRQA